MFYSRINEGLWQIKLMAHVAEHSVSHSANLIALEEPQVGLRAHIPSPIIAF